MIDPRYWLPHWRVRRALAGYPRYTVPHPQSEATLDVALAMKNFDHFMTVRLDRLAAFREWLSRHFGVAAALDEPGLRAIDAWAKRYGGGLVVDHMETVEAFAYYKPAWEGALACCNIMVDLGIFFGEFLIAQRPRLRWICYLDCPEGNVPEDIPGFGRPQIGGFVHPWAIDAFQSGEHLLLTARNRSEIWYDPILVSEPGLTRECQQIYKMADAPDDGKPFIF
jgi:hypothetical protein